MNNSMVAIFIYDANMSHIRHTQLMEGKMTAQLALFSLDVGNGTTPYFDALTAPAARAVWIPNMKVGKLKRLLSKTVLSSDDIEDLKDFKYFLINQQDDAVEKGFYERYLANQKGAVYVLKDKFWLTNIDSRIAEFEFSTGADTQSSKTDH